MPRNSVPRRYTGRKNTRPLWIFCLLLLLAALLLLYCWQTNAQFRSAVARFTGSLQGQDEPTPAGADEPAPLPPEQSSPLQEPDPQTPPSQQPDPVQPQSPFPKGLLLTLSAAQLEQDMEQAVREAAQSGAAGVVVELKLSGGQLAYQSSLQNDAVAKASSEDSFDLEALHTLCRENGLFLVGRFSAFLDHLAAGALPDACTCVEGGVPFLDANYQRSLDPYRPQALSYLTLLLEEICPSVDCVLLSDLLSVLMTVGLLMAILIALIFLVAGDWLTALLSSVFPHATALLRTWNLLKALIPPAFFFILLLCLYTVAPNRHVSPWSALPGTLFSMCFWLLFSYAFSWYVGSADRYSFLYGSLGGIVVLLLWLYFSGIVLVMGAHLNYIVMTGAAWRSRQSFIMSGNAPYYVFKD